MAQFMKGNSTQSERTALKRTEKKKGDRRLIRPVYVWSNDGVTSKQKSKRRSALRRRPPNINIRIHKSDVEEG